MTAVHNMYHKVIWVALVVFAVTCAALSVHHEDLDDDEFETHRERNGKICKFYIINIHVQSRACWTLSLDCSYSLWLVFVVTVTGIKYKIIIQNYLHSVAHSYTAKVTVFTVSGYCVCSGTIDPSVVSLAPYRIFTLSTQGIAHC